MGIQFLFGDPEGVCVGKGEDEEGFERPVRGLGRVVVLRARDQYRSGQAMSEHGREDKGWKSREPTRIELGWTGRRKTDLTDEQAWIAVPDRQTPVSVENLFLLGEPPEGPAEGDP